MLTRYSKNLKVLTIILAVLSATQVMAQTKGNGKGKGKGQGKGNQTQIFNNNNNEVLLSGGGKIDWGFNPNWALNQGYIGNPQFRLIDNPRLSDAMRDARRVNKRIQDLLTQIKPLQGQISAKENRVDSLKTEVSNLNTAIANLQTKIDNHQTKVQAAKDAIPALQSKLTNIDSQIINLNQSKSNAQKEVQTAKNLQAQYTANKPALNEKLKLAFQACMAEGKIPATCLQDARIIAIQNEIKENEKNIAASGPKILALQKTVQSIASQITNKQSEKTTTAQAITNKQNIVSNSETTLANLKTEKRQKNQQKTTAQSNLTTAQSQLTGLKTQVAPLITQKQNLDIELAQEVREARRIRRALIDRVIGANREGHRVGSINGGNIGSTLAYNLGQERGNLDGNLDGNNEGTSAGEERDYNNGYVQGEQIGQARAEAEGQRDGQALGRSQGNSEAGAIAGRAKGIENAINSDAAAVGQKQGVKDGMDRAIADGYSQGTPLGEQKAIEAHENIRLKSAQVSGSFTGTFSAGIPSYPGVSQPSYRFCDQYRARIVRLACADGLNIGHYDNAQAAFQANIANYYQQAYSASYRAAYDQAFSQHYPQAEQAGVARGEADKFASAYPGIKESYRQQSYSYYVSNPETGSSEYTSNYAQSKASAYSAKYEEIRADKFSYYTAKVYRENIQSQTKKYSDTREDQVSNIYKKHPVLSYVGSSISDGGIQAVAKLDGVYMPDEKVVFDITVKNFGLIAATDAKLVLSDGRTVNLPTIAAQSEVLVSAAGVVKVTKESGQQERVASQITRRLSSTDKRIEGRHFYNAATGAVNAADAKTIQVNYPMDLSEIAVIGDLIVGRPANLQAKVTNYSNRTYQGPINLKITTSLGNVMTKEFPSINTLKKSALLKEAELLITNNNDALETISFNLVIEKNGVALGGATSAGSKLVQVAYIEKAGAKVLLGDAKTDRLGLLDALKNQGGIENVSVVDLALDQKGVIESLSNKVVVLAQSRANGSLISAVDSLINNASNAVLVADRSSINALEELKANASSLKLAATLKLSLATLKTTTVTVPNIYVNKNAKGTIIVNTLDTELAKNVATLTQGDADDMTEKVLTMFDQAMILDMLDSMTIASTTKLEVQKILSRIYLEAAMVNEVYDDSSKAGRKLIKKLKKDKKDNLVKLSNRLEEIVDDADSKAAIGAIIILHELDYALDNIKPLSKIKSSVRSATMKRVEKNLSKLEKKLSKITSSDFKRKFIKRQTGYNRLVNNFTPVIEE